MKKVIFFLFISVLSMQFLSAQKHCIDCVNFCSYPPTSVVNGETYWWGEPIFNMLERAELIFEGRILSDSALQNEFNDDLPIDYRVLILKQFKGTFTSDTIAVQEQLCCLKIGDEALFILYSNSNTYHFLHGPGCGFIGVCNRPDIVKEVYEPIEAYTGQKYIEVHPNTCKQVLKKK